MTSSAASKVARALVACVVVVALLAVSVAWRDYDRERAAVERDRTNCLASKRTSRLLAASWAAHRDYLEAVLAASSVKGDVKRAARTANATHRRTVARLRARSRRDCIAEYPAAKLLGP